MRRWWWNVRTLSVAIVVGPLLGACVGSLGDDDPAGSDLVVDPGQNPFGETIGATTRFARLTHAQWDNTVADLFDFDGVTSFSSEFRSDAKSGSYLFDNDTVVLSVDQGLMGAYERAAAEVAALVVNDQARFDAIVPSGADEDQRARDFITTFGERVHRRPLTPGEVDGYFALYQQGRDSYTDTTGLVGGVRLTLEAMLVSPYFLYRTELSSEPLNGMVPLDDWEIASRLSYLLWNTMPDTALFDLARAGQLRDPATLRDQIERMLGDERATAVFTRMHAQLFGVAKFETINPNPDAYPDVPADMVDLAKAELDHVLADAFESGRTYHDLLTEPRTFVNQDLAPLYGLSGTFGADFEEVSLDPNERAGLLTLTGFLASNATSVNPDPIHRGVFVSKYLLCTSIGAPPGDIPPLPTPDPEQTNREAIETLTEVPGSDCAACHTNFINPFGFPFEMYDASGALRSDDRGNPLDLVTTPTLDGEPTEVSDALDLVGKIADSDEAYACYAKHVTEYLMGRSFVDGDATLRDALATRAAEGAPIREVMADALASPQLTHRAFEEGAN